LLQDLNKDGKADVKDGKADVKDGKADVQRVVATNASSPRANMHGMAIRGNTMFFMTIRDDHP